MAALTRCAASGAAVNWVVRLSGAVHDFVVVLAPRIAYGVSIGLLFTGIRGWWDRASLHDVLDLVHDCSQQTVSQVCVRYSCQGYVDDRRKTLSDNIQGCR